MVKKGVRMGISGKSFVEKGGGKNELWKIVINIIH